jgi:ABC-2 type transport system permease protein
VRSLANIFWLGTKELRSFFHDYVLVGLILWAFSLAVYAQAQSSSQELRNAAIAIIDEDNSSLSHIIIEVFFLLILAAHIAGGGEAQIAPMLSVPVFL